MSGLEPLHNRMSRRPSLGAWRRRKPGARALGSLAAAVALGVAPSPSGAAGLLRWASDGVALCTATGNQLNPQAVSDGAGGAIVTWQDRRGNYDDIYAQRVRADGTTAPGWPVNGVVLCAAAFNQSIPQIVSDGAGGAIVTWQDNRNPGSSDIFAQRVLAGGMVDPQWPVNGVALCPDAAGSQGTPQIAPDGAAGAIVTWQDSRNGSADIYAQHVLASGTVDPGWTADGVALCTATKVQSYPQIASDGAGGAFVSWHDSRVHPVVDLYDIYAQRVTANGTIAPGWPVDGLEICTASSSQLYPEIVSDGAGGAIITWDDRRTGQPIDPIYQEIYAQRVNAAGVPLWTVNGVVLCNAVSTQEKPQIVSDGTGGAIVAWQDHRSTTYDIYAQHVKANGSIDPSLPVNGVAVCVAPASQENPVIASDGVGGAILAWQDTRLGGTNPQNIYAQRINDNPCASPGPLPQSCGLVDWTQVAGGSFFDIANWNGGAGPVPSGVCPASCTLYDVLFSIGNASYGVAFGADATSAVVTVGAGDDVSFSLAGHSYQMDELRLEGAGSSLTVSAGTVAVDGVIQIGMAAGLATADRGRSPGVAGGTGASLRMEGASGSATMSGGSLETIVFVPGGALISATPIPYDFANAGTLSPGGVADGAGTLAVSASYTQTSGGRLVVDLGGDAPGSGYDVVRVSGAATLGGALEWKLTGGYLPAIGTRFEVLIAHPRIGTFKSVREDIDVAYTDTSVVLISTAATPALVSLVSAEAEPGRVKVRWWMSDGAPVTIRRDRGTGAWDVVAVGYPDGTGLVSYEDTDVTPGRYGYRLGLSSDAGEIAAGEVWVEVPVASRFGLAGVSPNPAVGPLRISFSLGDALPAALELYDPAGRRVASRAIESPRPGNRVLVLGGERALPAGVYVLRLSQGARHASSRVAIVR